MATLQEESLFSLELVVDKLTMPNVPCRFPAVAFRLLDFPTLVIYHVEPELGDSIKSKIKSDPYYKLGNQFSELLDNNGSYSIRKGKSCLLKISPDMLLSHLASTPLYVMIIDTYPEVPKLIANCTVPLDSVMDVLYDDICKQGLAVPTVRGEKGVYKIYNLMGKQIGGLVLGVRLLSLGVGLIPHLPAASVSRLPKQLKSHDVVTVASKKEKDKIQEQVADIVLEDLEIPKHESKLGKPQIDIQIQSPMHQFQVHTQTEQELLQNIATQTEKRKRQKRNMQVKQGLDIESCLNENVIDDIVVTNTVCPPPLFFNSEMESKTISGLLLADLKDQQSHNPSTIDDFSDDDTIRPEDWKSDSDEEVPRIESKSVKQKTIQKVSVSKNRNTSYQSKNITNMKSFPLLNALMTEISALQGQPQSSRVNQLEPEIYIAAPPKFPSQRRPRSPSPSNKMPSLSRSPSPGRERESVEKYLNRMSTPRHTVRELPSPKTPRRTLPEPKKPLKLHKCQAAPKGVPKNRSWIRKVPPPMAVQKTKLAYGMTNTQRLRLERSNPGLLKTLEQKEQERVEQWKEQRRIMEEEKLAEGTMGTTDTAIYGYDGHRIDNTYQMHIHAHKKPVPTPRSHYHPESEYPRYEAYVPPARITKSPKNQMEDVLQKDHSDADSYKSDYSITSDGKYKYEESDKEATDQLDEGFSGQLDQVEGDYTNKHYPNPGFPVTDSVETRENDDEYSYDFQSGTHRTNTEPFISPKDKTEKLKEVSMSGANIKSIDAGEALGLRKIVDQYSDDESQQSFKSANSNVSNVSEIGYIPSNANRMQGIVNQKLFSNMEGPKISVATPGVTHIRNGHYRGKAGESAATIEASYDSTAYISRSQVLSQQSYESNVSTELNGNNKQGLQYVKPRARPRRNTESVSSYNGEDNENISPRSGVSQVTQSREYLGYESESFEDASEPYLQEPLSVDQAKLAPEARFGYTWGY